MMNQGGTTDSITTLDPYSLEQHQVVDSSQAHTSSYYSPSTGYAAAPWTTHRADNVSVENGVLPNSSYQSAEPHSRNFQDGLSVASVASTSTSGAANVPHAYSNYATYHSGYSNTGYEGYYNGYPQQSNQSYPQPVGAYQSTGAPYQPLSSFPNTVSYPGPANYSSTYYNPGDYQTSGGYQSGGYSNQTNLWYEGNSSSNISHQYPNYTTETNDAYSSSSAATSLQYQQHYKQWADYYNPTEVTCAPGTENISVTSTSSIECPVSGVTGAYSASTGQPPAPFTPWRPESNTSELHAVQPGAAFSGVHDSYWKYGVPGFQNNHGSSLQPNAEKPVYANPTCESFQNQQKSDLPQGPNTLYPSTNQAPPSYQSSLQTVPQTVQQTFPPLDPCSVSKLQIPTNPRIASDMVLGFPRKDKDSSASSVAAKPAYISVSLLKPNDKVASHDTADSVLKPGKFPKSLRGYVERALARCKDDTQKAACQAVLKEVITRATADNTLYTRDWDTEPLFLLPNSDLVNKEHASILSTPISSLPKNKRSPSRRSKSRWEPMPEEKPVDKPAPVSHDTVKYGCLIHVNERDKQFSGGKSDKKEDNFSNIRFSLPVKKSANKNAPRPAKRQRQVGGLSPADNGEASSDSDKEQSLTAYYSAAIALAESPEERKRRENRSKRFEKVHGKRAENNHFRRKTVGAGNLYARRASALVLSKNIEDSGSKAVEDIDWDALTVKGTCQEIEKRYLRLTSAPDPATVRPEEVLEKALWMVQNSEKNYFYKCDQLKSIRQDLTVQHIRNELTVKVYETHARLAIEVGDLAEYNQCQSQLKTLYAEGIKGCHMEFSAYNLLCVILHSNNNRDLLSAMSRLSVEARNDEAVKHALAVRTAVTSGNYVQFFRLYKTAPNLNTCLMDLYVEKMRYAAVRCMSRSCRPTVPVSYIAQVLSFPTVLPTTGASGEKETDGLEECVEWLKAHGACLITENSGEMLLDTKASVSSLYMPEPEDAVAHGDSSLAVNDFLTKNS